MRPADAGFLRWTGPPSRRIHCATACGGKVVRSTKGGTGGGVAMEPLRGPGSKGSARLQRSGSEGCGVALWDDKFYMPLRGIKTIQPGCARGKCTPSAYGTSPGGGGLLSASLSANLSRSLLSAAKGAVKKWLIFYQIARQSGGRRLIFNELTQKGSPLQCHFDRSVAEWRNLPPQWHKPHCDGRSLDSEPQ